MMTGIFRSMTTRTTTREGMAMTTVIENIDQKVIDIIREVVAENPEFVYPVADMDFDRDDDENFAKNYDPEWHISKQDGGCRYQYEGEPRCLIGHVVHRIAPGFDLEEQEGQGASTVMRLLGASDAIRDAASIAQAKQDSGHSWSYALEKFEQELVRNGVTA